MASRPVADLGPRFDRAVPPGGYAWWYVDGWSNDRTRGLTIIAFVGSVFSPYYALARRRGRGPADPLDHCALNVALYGKGGRWAMTERGARSVGREPNRFVIGPSDLTWDGKSLTIRFDEVCAPIPKRARGLVRVTPGPLLSREFLIDGTGRHRWRPISPLARIEFRGEAPALDWRGEGYLDFNEGDEPLEAAFSDWTWGSARTQNGARLFYDVKKRDGERLSLALDVDRDGATTPAPAPPLAPLPRPFWRMDRPARCDPDARPQVETTLEDAPFYARSRVATRLSGEDVVMMHESLSLARFSSPVVQAMLPFRMPRRR